MALQKLVAASSHEACDIDSFKREKFALLKVTAKWCGPCRKIQPDFERVCLENRVPAYCLDIEEVADMAKGDSEAREFLDQLEVDKLPTFILFKGGLEASRRSGASLEAIEQFCQMCVNENPPAEEIEPAPCKPCLTRSRTVG